MLPQEDHEELFYQIALTFVDGIGAKRGRALLEKYGSAWAVYRTSLKELKNAEGVGEIKVKAFKDPEVLKMAERELNYVLKNDVQPIYFGHNYPHRLSNCSDAPLVLYYKGNADLNTAKIVAVVGTRRNTDYGHQLCEELVDGLRS